MSLKHMLLTYSAPRTGHPYCGQNWMINGAHLQWVMQNIGAWGSVVVKALCYKLEGRRIDSKQWRLEFILWQLTFPCALGSTQPLKNGGKCSRCVRVTTLPPSCAKCRVIWSLNQPEPPRSHMQNIRQQYQRHLVKAISKSKMWTINCNNYTN